MELKQIILSVPACALQIFGLVAFPEWNVPLGAACVPAVTAGGRFDFQVPDCPF